MGIANILFQDIDAYAGPLAMMPVIACFKVYRIFNKYNNTTLHSPYIFGSFFLGIVVKLGPYRPRLPYKYVAEQKQEPESGHEQEPESGEEQEPESGQEQGLETGVSLAGARGDGGRI